MDPPMASSDPVVHMAHQAANPTPTFTPTSRHPPYVQMITAAITALKERNGSSKTAIAKYMDRVFSGLPPSHSALLTHHLKRMKSNGQLLMLKHSYKLPTLPVPAANGGGHLSLPPSGPTRRPGRPPKPRPHPQFQNPKPLAHFQFPPQSHTNVALGSPAKRGRGRPRKLAFHGPAVAAAAGGRPSNSVLLGRVGPNRGPGRPRRSGLGARPKEKAAGMVSWSTKRRGRPPKNVNASSYGGFVAALRVPIADFAAPPAPNGFLAAARRRGRPAKASDEPRKSRKLSGKPLGRPKKALATGQAMRISDPQLSVAIQNLKGKLDYFQSTVRLSLSLIKPCLNNQTHAAAISACHDLEELAAMDICVPLNIQKQPPFPSNQEMPLLHREK